MFVRHWIWSEKSDGVLRVAHLGSCWRVGARVIVVKKIEINISGILFVVEVEDADSVPSIVTPSKLVGIAEIGESLPIQAVGILTLSVQPPG